MNKITYEERAKVYAQAAETFGFDTQITVAVEEMSELTKELCKMQRGEDRLEALVEEIADVTIMLEQLRILYDVNDRVCAVMDSKVERLAWIIKKEKEAAHGQE